LPPWRLDVTGPVSVAAGGGGESYRDALVAEFGPALGARLAFHEAEFDADKLARRYGALDVFCYPSLADRGETFGVAVAEAMAAGAAPVVSNLACFRELVHDGDTGLVFDHAAPDAEVRLAGALARLVRDTTSAARSPGAGNSRAPLRFRRLRTNRPRRSRARRGQSVSMGRQSVGDVHR